MQVESNSKKEHLYLLLSIILFALFSRLAVPSLFSHLPNFSAINALALFCGAHCRSRLSAVLIALTTIYLSDAILADTFLYTGWYWQYGSYAIITLLGTTLKNRITLWNASTASLSSAVIFFIISNFGVWFSTALYRHTLDGLITCYVLALPFFKATLASDILFIGAFFSSYFLIVKMSSVRMASDN